VAIQTVICVAATLSKVVLLLNRPAWAGHCEAIHSLMAMHTKGYRILYSFTVESTTPDPESSRSGPANTPLQPTAEKRGG